MSVQSIGAFAGGLGLFLLGMLMLTDGLKLAAGGLLQEILRRFTRTPLRGLASDVIVTALVQSSTAVTVALIGFINAGLLTFGQSLWVIFGANLGTSMTGWLVALAGFQLSIETFALPIVALGMALHLSGPKERRGGAGTAIAGFGVLFLGLELLQSAFGDLAERVELPSGNNPLVLLAMLFIGFGMTVVMQSSSAALAVTLTAAQAGVIGISGAAVVVVGVNVGTTATAVLAAMGATSNAKRAAAAHILFNMITGAAALLVLPILLPLLLTFQEDVLGDDTPAVSLALFHTAFNALGVLLMVPIASRIARRLEGMFGAGESRVVRPEYLDETVAGIPELAVSALTREIIRMGALASDGALAALHRHHDPQDAQQRRESIAILGEAANTFVVAMHRAGIAADTSRTLAHALRAKRSYEAIGHELPRLNQWPRALDPVDPFIAESTALLQRAHPATGQPDVDLAAASADASYRNLRSRLLLDGASSAVPVDDMEAALNTASTIRRVVKKAVEAHEMLRAEPRLIDPEGCEPHPTDG